MKTIDVLAAIGVATIVVIAVKTAMALNEVINGPFFPKAKES